MKMKRILSAVLAMVLTAGLAASFSGCSKTKMPEKQTVDHVYRVKTVNLPEGLNYVAQMSVSGDKLLMTGYYYNEDSGESGNRTYQMNLDGTGLTRVENTAPIDENSYEQTSVSAADGSTWRVSLLICRAEFPKPYP